MFYIPFACLSPLLATECFSLGNLVSTKRSRIFHHIAPRHLLFALQPLFLGAWVGDLMSNWVNIIPWDPMVRAFFGALLHVNSYSLQAKRRQTFRPHDQDCITIQNDITATALFPPPAFISSQAQRGHAAHCTVSDENYG